MALKSRVDFLFRTSFFNEKLELNLNFAENVASFQTFEVTFFYNRLNLRLELE